jgi:uncharacterized protein YjbJ (UPF0337 family)
VKEGNMTDHIDERLRFEGKWDQLVGTIKEKTGESMDAIERKLRELSNR